MKRTIRQIKSTVYDLLGVATTKQVKKLYPEFDLRQRQSWLDIEIAILGRQVDAMLKAEADAVWAASFGKRQNEVLMDELWNVHCATITDEAADKVAEVCMAIGMADGNNIVPFHR